MTTVTPHNQAAAEVASEVFVSLRLFWRVFWKTSVISTAVSSIGFLFINRGDLAGRPALEVAIAVAIVLVYCAFYSLWFSVAVAASAVIYLFGGGTILDGIFRLIANTAASAWRACGGWIVFTLVGVVAGAAGGIALALDRLQNVDFRGAGLHGGGEIAVAVIGTVLIVSAIVGGMIGGCVFGLPSLIALIAMRLRRSRRVKGAHDECP